MKRAGCLGKLCKTKEMKKKVKNEARVGGGEKMKKHSGSSASSLSL